MICPNTNTTEWKDLLVACNNDKNVAMGYFIANNYTIPSVVDGVIQGDITPTEDIHELVGVMKLKEEELRKVKANAIDIITKEYRRAEGDNKKLFMDLIENLQEATTLWEFGTFIQEAKDILESIKYIVNDRELVNLPSKELSSEELNMYKLTNLKKMVDSFEILNDIVKYVATFENKDVASLDTVKSDFVKEATQVLGEVKLMQEQIRGKSKELLVNELAKRSTKIRDNYRLQYQRDYRKINPDNTKGMDAYVEAQINLNKNKIEAEERGYIRSLLIHVNQDIDAVTKLAGDSRGTNDHLLQVATQLLDETAVDITQDFIEARDKFTSVWEIWIVAQPQGIIQDPKKLYSKFIRTRDGVEYLISDEYSQEFIDNRTDYYKKVRELELDIFRARSKSAADMMDNPEEVANLLDKKAALSKAYYSKHYDRDAKGNSTIKLKYKANHKLSGVDLEMLIALNDIARYSDSPFTGLNASKRLSNRLPAVNKFTLEERLQGGTKSLIDSLKDIGREGVNDLNIQDNMIDGHKGVAIRYRGKAEDQSYDLPAIYLANLHMAINFKEKTKLTPMLELLGGFFDSRTVGKRDYSGQKMVKHSDGTMSPETTSGLSSNSAWRYKQLLETRLYNTPEEDVAIFGKSVRKLTGSVLGLSAQTMLGANWLGGIANLVQGETNAILAGYQGVWWKGQKTLYKAKQMYYREFRGIMEDIGSTKPKTLNNQLMEHLNLGGNLSAFTKAFQHNNAFRKIANGIASAGLGTAVYNAPEHFMLSQIMWACLEEMKVVNSDGKFLTKTGTTDNIEEAMSLADAYTTKDGKMTLDPRVVTVHGKLQADNVDATIKNVSAYVKAAAAAINGEYDEQNRAAMSRFWWGRAITFMRTWVYRGVQERWGGVSTSFAKDVAGKSYEDIDVELKHYEQSGKRFKEGTYVTAIRFLQKMYNEVGFLRSLYMIVPGTTSNKNAKGIYNDMTDMEKGNVIKALAELSFLVTCSILSIALAHYAEGDERDPKDDNMALWTAAYLMKRNASDLTFFTMIGVPDILRIIKNPTYALKTIDDSWNIMTQALKEIFVDAFGADGLLELDRYKTGRNKGDTKLFHKMMKMFPVYHNGLKDPEQLYNYFDQAN